MRPRRFPLALGSGLALLVACHDLSSIQPNPCYDTDLVAVNGMCEEAPSCANLPLSCGPDQNDKCCATADVPGGSYLEGEDYGGTGPLGFETNVQATVSPFTLDKYEVTVGRFRAFVADYDAFMNNPPPTGAGDDPNALLVTTDAGQELGAWQQVWDLNPADVPQTAADLVAAIDQQCDEANEAGFVPGTWTDSPGANENKPITCVTWFEAYLFCIYDHARLPTEAEWEFAAAGGNQQRAYPWSFPNFADTTVTADDADMPDPNGPVDVGSKPAGVARWGHFDMTGNAYEWVLDAPVLLEAYPGGENPIDVSGMLAPSLPRMVRGGSFESDSPLKGRTSARYPASATDRYRDIGIRCARDSL